MSAPGTAFRKDGRKLVELPDEIDLASGPLRVRQVGRVVMIEPAAAPEALVPGSYTRETLPPLSEGARAILASVDAAVTRMPPPTGRKSGRTLPGGRVSLEDEGSPGISLDDEGLPGIDPDA